MKHLKHFLFFLTLFLLSGPLSGQIITTKKGVKRDLKKEMSHYVVINYFSEFDYYIEIPQKGYWYFIDKQTEKELGFKEKAMLMNFMWENGWKLHQLILPKSTYDTPSSEKSETMVFERKNPAK